MPRLKRQEDRTLTLVTDGDKGSLYLTSSGRRVGHFLSGKASNPIAIILEQLSQLAMALTSIIPGSHEGIFLECLK